MLISLRQPSFKKKSTSTKHSSRDDISPASVIITPKGSDEKAMTIKSFKKGKKGLKKLKNKKIHEDANVEKEAEDYVDAEKLINKKFYKLNTKYFKRQRSDFSEEEEDIKPIIPRARPDDVSKRKVNFKITDEEIEKMTFENFHSMSQFDSSQSISLEHNPFLQNAESRKTKAKFEIVTPEDSQKMSFISESIEFDEDDDLYMSTHRREANVFEEHPVTKESCSIFHIGQLNRRRSLKLISSVDSKRK